MKLTVICNKAGEIESVAQLSAAPGGSFHFEVEGAGTTHEISVDDTEIEPDGLLGRKGPDAQRKALEKLKHKLPRRP